VSVPPLPQYQNEKYSILLCLQEFRSEPHGLPTAKVRGGVFSEKIKTFLIRNNSNPKAFAVAWSIEKGFTDTYPRTWVFLPSCAG